MMFTTHTHTHKFKLFLQICNRCNENANHYRNRTKERLNYLLIWPLFHIVSCKLLINIFMLIALNQSMVARGASTIFYLHFKSTQATAALNNDIALDQRRLYIYLIVTNHPYGFYWHGGMNSLIESNIIE